MSLADLLELPARIGVEQEIILTAVKRWFCDHSAWLLIFDNVEDGALLSEYIPAVGNGAVLITGRSQIADVVGETITIDTMQPDEGALLLLLRAKMLQAGELLQNAAAVDITQAREIVRLVAGHPLALDQVGAYIEETKTPLAQYLHALRQHSTSTINQHSPVLDFSLHALKSVNAGATELLKFCAFLHHDAIPADLIIAGVLCFSPALQAVVSDPRALNAAIEELVKFSLVQRNRETGDCMIDRQTQIMLKGEMDEAEQRRWAECAVRAVNRVFPEVEFELWPRCQQYLPHAFTCIELVQQWEIELPEAGRLLHVTGSYLYERAQYSVVASLYERASALRTRVLGAEHPDTAQTLNDQGELARKQSRYAAAKVFYEQALAIRTCVLGAEHPDTAQTLNNLGELAHTQGNYILAETFYQRALAIRELALGPAHPDTIRSIGDVAGIYDEQGKYAQAEPLYQKARMLCEKSLGLEHPDTALALGKLARFYRVQEDYTQAEPLFKQALMLTQQTLGPDHPEVATLLNNLAVLYRIIGEYAQAEQLLQQAIEIWKQVFGTEHRNTAASLNNLARVYSEQGKYAQAEPLYLQVLALRKNDLGQEHPSVAQTLANLGDLYCVQQQYTQAEPLYQQALAIYEQKLGSAHPDTVAVQQNYTILLEKMSENEH
jgi:tetratricopeptide (TPR) repeat protein